MATNITNYHAQYLDVTSQHWHSNSARYAGGDNLLTALNNGWEIEACYAESVVYAGARSVSIYRFVLKRDGEVVQMPVIDNPYVTRFVEQSGITVQQSSSDENAKSA